MSNKRLSEKIQRLGSALQVLSDEYQQLRSELEVKEPPVRRRSLKPIRKAYYAALLKKGKA